MHEDTVDDGNSRLIDVVVGLERELDKSLRDGDRKAITEKNDGDEDEILLRSACGFDLNTKKRELLIL